MTFVWKSEYDLGIPSIDEQHRGLVVLINTLSEHISKKSSPADVDVILGRVEEHAREHFAYEESFFEACSYEEAPSHKNEHLVFLGRIEKFRIQAKSDDPLVFIEVLGYLEQWFLHHVQVVDRRYVEAFHAIGVE
ncbi:MAG: bacteriohemerythrin [Candidatus Moraniibacteriota bacterium]